MAGKSELAEAAERLRRGEVIGFPTESFYGLGADPAREQAVEAILELKSRGLEAGIPLIIDGAEQVENWIDRGSESDLARTKRLELTSRFWPGPLTIVIKARAEAQNKFQRGIFGPDCSLAMRVSSQLLARKLAGAIGGIITATSANPKGQAPPQSAAAVRAYFPELIVLEGGEGECLPRALLPSTIVDVRAYPFKLLRVGAVSVEELEPLFLRLAALPLDRQ